MVSTDLEVCAKVAKESRSEYTTPLARAARLIECPRRTANRSTKNYTSRFLLPLPGGRVSKAKQNIPIAKPCVYTDRKSTRLNSSHSQISYAVFCLKKKK